jgi:hypothetical protein
VDRLVPIPTSVVFDLWQGPHGTPAPRFEGEHRHSLEHTFICFYYKADGRKCTVPWRHVEVCPPQPLRSRNRDENSLLLPLVMISKLWTQRGFERKCAAGCGRSTFTLGVFNLFLPYVGCYMHYYTTPVHRSSTWHVKTSVMVLYWTYRSNYDPSLRIRHL